MLKRHIKRTRLLCSKNHSTVCTKYFNTLKIEEHLNPAIFVCFSFL